MSTKTPLTSDNWQEAETKINKPKYLIYGLLLGSLGTAAVHRFMTGSSPSGDLTNLAEEGGDPVCYNEIVYGGHEGDWTQWKYPYNGGYACGVQVHIEEAWAMGDDEQWTGFKVKFCHRDDWNNQEVVDVTNGDGYFQQNEWLMCPEDQWISQASMEYEDFLGAGRAPGMDDTAANGLKIKCISPEDEEEVIKTSPGSFGEWKEWTNYREGNFIRKVKARYDNSVIGDQSGLNGLIFYMCPIDEEAAAEASAEGEGSGESGSSEGSGESGSSEGGSGDSGSGEGSA